MSRNNLFSLSMIDRSDASRRRLDRLARDLQNRNARRRFSESGYLG